MPPVSQLVDVLVCTVVLVILLALGFLHALELLSIICRWFLKRIRQALETQIRAWKDEIKKW